MTPDPVRALRNLTDITAADLLDRAVRYARPRQGVPARRAQPRWHCVADTFQITKLQAEQLCLKFGVNPEDLLR